MIMPKCGQCGISAAFHELRPIQDGGLCIDCLEKERADAALSETHLHIQKYANELCVERTENLKLKKACTEMREVLRDVQNALPDGWWARNEYYVEIETVLNSTTTGTGYFSRDEIKPLVDFIRMAGFYSGHAAACMSTQNYKCDCGLDAHYEKLGKIEKLIKEKSMQ